MTMLQKLAGTRTVVKELQSVKPFAVQLHRSDHSHSAQVTEDVSVSAKLREDEVEIEVRAVGLNTIDSAILLGQISNVDYGRQCSGVITRVGSSSSSFRPGDRVCAYGTTSLLKSSIRTRQSLVARIPEWLSFAEASPLPQDYLAADFLVRNVLRIRNNDTVLIHAGQSRIARLAISLVQKTCPNLFVTLPTQRDVKMLRTVSDTVQVSLRDSFAKEEFHHTFPSGADMVVDFADSDIQELVECASTFGQVVCVKAANQIVSENRGGFSVPANISFKMVDIADILRLPTDNLEMPTRRLGDRWVLDLQSESSQVHAFKLSSMETAIASLRDLKSESRIAVEFDEQDEVSVSVLFRISRSLVRC